MFEIRLKAPMTWRDMRRRNEMVDKSHLVDSTKALLCHDSERTSLLVVESSVPSIRFADIAHFQKAARQLKPSFRWQRLIFNCVAGELDAADHLLESRPQAAQPLLVRVHYRPPAPFA